MTVTYIRWRDAFHGLDEWEVEKIEPIELHEVGFLIKDNEDSVILSTEQAEGDATTRLWICIPKANILERRDMELEKAFPQRRRRKS